MRDVGGREPVRPEIDELYDAFKHSRADRADAAAARPRPRRAPTWARSGTRCSTCSTAARCDGRRLDADGFAFGMIVQHEQQHDETMLATHQLRAGAPVLHAPPPPPAAPVPRARGARAGRAVHHGHLHRAVGAGQRASGARRRPARVLDRRRPGHQRRSTRRSSPTAATTTRAGGASAGWAHRARGRAARAAVLAPRRRRHGGGGASACVEPVPADEPVVHVCWYEARGVRALGGQAAADRGGVGEGGPLRPGDRPVAALPVGRRRPDRRARQPRPAPPAAGPGRRLPGGRVAAGRAPADRRRLGVDVLAASAALPGLRRVPLPRSTRRSSSAATTGCCAAARSAPTRPPAGARSATGTTRSGGRSSPASGCARDARTGGGRCRCAGTWPTSARRCTLRALLLDPPHSLLRQSWAPAGHARRRHGQRRRVRRRLVRRRRAEPVPLPQRRPIWTRPAFADAGRGDPRAARCWPRCARPPPGMPVADGGGRARSPRAAGCSATTAWSAAGRTSVATLAAALPVTDLLTLDAPDRLGAAVGAGPRTGCARASDPADALADVVRDGRRRRAGSRLNLLLTDGATVVATAWRPRAVGARRRRARCCVASEPSTTTPAGRRSPTGTCVVATPAATSTDLDDPLAGRAEDSMSAGPTARRSTSPTEDLERGAARRRPGRADRRPEVAAAEVVLRRPGQRAVRGDHPAARVLPDPRRAGDAGRARPTRSPRSTGPRRWSSWAPARRRRPGCCSTRSAAPGTLRHVRAAGRERVARCARRRDAIAADYPGLRGARRGRRLHPRTSTGCPPGGRRGWWRSSAAPSATCCPRERAAFLHRRCAPRCGRASGCCSAPTWSRIRPVLVPAYDDAAGRDRRVQPQRAARAQPGAGRRLRPSTRSTTSPCGTRSRSGSRCGCGPSGR